VTSAPAITTLALFVRLDARTGREDEVEALLRSIQPLVGATEPVRCWFALQMAPQVYGLFSTFDSEADREAYLQVLSQVWAERTSELLSRPPVTEKVEVLVAQPSTLSAAEQLHAAVSADPGTGRAHGNVREVPKVGSKDAPGG
jgi:hypothetical protein